MFIKLVVTDEKRRGELELLLTKLEIRAPQVGQVISREIDSKKGSSFDQATKSIRSRTSGTFMQSPWFDILNNSNAGSEENNSRILTSPRAPIEFELPRSDCDRLVPGQDGPRMIRAGDENMVTIFVDNGNSFSPRQYQAQHGLRLNALNDSHCLSFGVGRTSACERDGFRILV